MKERCGCLTQGRDDTTRNDPMKRGKESMDILNDLLEKVKKYKIKITYYFWWTGSKKEIKSELDKEHSSEVGREKR